MFDSLKNRLKSVQEKLSANIRSTGTPVPIPVPEKRDKREKSTRFSEKVKTLVRDRELILSDKDIAEPLSELEMILLENDVALPTTEAIISSLRSGLIGAHRKIGSSIDALVVESLRSALRGVLGSGFDLAAYIRAHEKPVKILFTGVNGTGKTTSIAKIARFLQKEGFLVVIASGDTYRAGAQEQLSTHARRVDTKVIQHQTGADPTAVIYDAVQYATAHGTDVVLADTAGRFHNRANLMNQLEKIRRVIKPDLVIYVDEAVAGNDAVVRAEEFNRLVGTDAVMLTKADMDMKGGAAISIAHTIGKPLVFLGTGQGYDDLKPFSPDTLVNELLGEA
ncbi:MAG: signal recognition particle-docking protein FtsY [Methanomicrobiales archaeon]|nr:signal recognition particle-docking protein FtsY [Methanomicrobiales archaeon]